MKSLFVVAVCTLIVAACGKLEPADTVESLMANPERLKLLREQCKTDHASMGDAACNRVAEATRRRFMGDGKSPYANDPAPPGVSPDTAPPKD